MGTDHDAGLRTGRSGFDPGGCWEFFSSPPRPERLWGPPNQGSFRGGKVAGAWSWPLSFI